MERMMRHPTATIGLIFGLVLALFTGCKGDQRAEPQEGIQPEAQASEGFVEDQLDTASGRSLFDDPALSPELSAALESEDFSSILGTMMGVGEEGVAEGSQWQDRQMEENDSFDLWIRENLPRSLETTRERRSASASIYNDLVQLALDGIDREGFRIHESVDYRDAKYDMIRELAKEPVGDLSGMDLDPDRVLLLILYSFQHLDVSELTDQERDALRVHLAGLFHFLHSRADEHPSLKTVAGSLRREFATFIKGEE